MRDAGVPGLIVNMFFGLLVVAAAVLPWRAARRLPGRERTGKAAVRLGLVSMVGVCVQLVVWLHVWLDAAELAQVGRDFDQGSAVVWRCDDSVFAMLVWQPAFMGDHAHECVVRSRVAVGLLVLAGLGALWLQRRVARRLVARRLVARYAGGLSAGTVREGEDEVLARGLVQEELVQAESGGVREQLPGLRGWAGVIRRSSLVRGVLRVWASLRGVVRLVCGVAVVLSVALVTSPPFFVDAFASDHSVGVLLAGVERYQAVVDAQWSDPDLPQAGRYRPTKAEEHNWAVRDRLAKEGMPVVSATSSVRIVGTSEPGGDYGIVADVVVSTEFAYEDPGGGSVAGGTVTTLHQMNLGVRGQVMDDVDGAGEWSRAAEGPGGCAPVESSAESGPAQGGRSAEAGAGADVAGRSADSPGSGGGAVAAYALEWTGAPHDTDVGAHSVDPAYPVFADGSAPLVSQALRAGGWGERPGGWAGGLDREDTSVWSSDLLGPAGASRTWMSPAYQYAYVRCHAQGGGVYEPLENVWDARPGDLLYLDWGTSEQASRGTYKPVPDGVVDTVMVVTGAMPWGEPRVSQKSPNRSDVPLSHVIAMAEEGGRESLAWYGLARQE